MHAQVPRTQVHLFHKRLHLPRVMAGQRHSRIVSAWDQQPPQKLFDTQFLPRLQAHCGLTDQVGLSNDDPFRELVPL